MITRTIGLAGALVLGAAALVAAETKNVDGTLPMSATGTVTLEAHNGTIQVHAWDRAEVVVHVRIDSNGLSGSSYLFRNTTVDISGNQDRVSIRLKSPDQYGFSLWSLFGGDWERPELHYDITVPKTARLQLHDHNANADIRDVSGAVQVSTHNGAVRASNLAGPLELTMHNGYANIDFASFSQDSRIATHNGTVELALPASSRFDLMSRGHHMFIRSDFPVTTRASDFGRRDVSGSINGGGPDLWFTSHNGRLRLRSK